METLLILIGIGFLLICLIFTLFALLLYSGLFETVEVGAGNPPLGAAVIAYKYALGPYKETGPLFFQVAKIAPDNRAIGIYYDDPKKVEAKHLRYAVGCVLAEGEKEVDAELKRKFEEEGFKIISLPEVENAVRTTFPYASTFSIFIAISKVYPRLNDYIQEHKLCAHPYIELYDGKTIHFMAPLSKQDEFYVPECLENKDECAPLCLDESNEVKSKEELSLPMNEGNTESCLLDHPQANAPTVEKDEDIASMGDTAIVPPLIVLDKSSSKEENGSDEGSTSSFEEVKMEISEAIESQI